MRRQRVSSRLVSSRLVCCFFFIIFIASWGCLLGCLHSPPLSLSLSLSLTLHAVFISFHFVRGLELNLLENASNSKFYEFTTFRFLPQQPPNPLHPHYPLLLLDIFFLHPLLGSLRGDNCLAVCVCVMCKCNRKPT